MDWRKAWDGIGTGFSLDLRFSLDLKQSSGCRRVGDMRNNDGSAMDFCRTALQERR